MVAPAITRNPVELRGCCWLAALLSVVSGALRQLERGDYRGDAAADNDDVGYLNAVYSKSRISTATTSK